MCRERGRDGGRDFRRKFIGLSMICMLESRAQERETEAIGTIEGEILACESPD
jgi:hypothetical protein